MDISELITQLKTTYINKSNQGYLTRIIESMKEASDVGLNNILYEISTMDDNDLQKIRNELLTLFPDMYINIKEKRILIDWS